MKFRCPKCRETFHRDLRKNPCRTRVVRKNGVHYYPSACGAYDKVRLCKEVRR